MPPPVPRRASDRSPLADWRGRRVTVMGLGRFGGGVAVARWLAAQGARVTVTDSAPPEQLAESVAALDGAAESVRLGEHVAEDFTGADLIVVNPAVPERTAPLAAARSAGVPVTTEINLFLERNPAPVVGVTGSVGKSTTVAMIGAVLAAHFGQDHVWVGGNIGRSLLDALPQIDPRDHVVLELSSFQLARTPALRWSPQIAVLTNLAPNHLDWHETFANYVAAKLNLFRFQDPERDVAIIGDEPALRETFQLMHGDLAGLWRFTVDPRGDLLATRQSTSAIESDDQRRCWREVAVGAPGRHNRLNAAAALTVAEALAVPEAAARTALAAFVGLPYRLCRVGEADGVIYYNDSKATTPEAARTAIEAFDVPLLVILGGYDKGADFGEFARCVARRARYAACIGQTGPQLAQLIQAAGGQATVHADLSAAFAACRAAAQPGDVVLLSPACASWGQFVDYRARGALFDQLVHALLPTDAT